MSAKPEPQQNHLLAALAPEVQARLFPHLELVPLPLRALLYESRRPMRHVYFPTDSIISMQYMMENGSSTAISVVGNEGVFGITQVSQTAVCNRHHSISQQLCRWLMLSLDRLSSNHLTMTQEFISNMLGVRRESVTETALKLQKLGVISYSRGLIKVLDRPKLETLSCECYRVVKKETDLLLDYLPQRQVIVNADSIPTAVLQAL